MIIEALTFKLSLDFIKYLKKNRIDITDIRTKFFDKVQGSSEFVTYADVDALQNFYDKSYVPLDPCFLGDLVEYREYFNELKKIYVTGIYSPCYAVPGWSQGTWYLDQLRKTLTASSTVSEFPYESNTATKNPTE